MTDLVVLSLEGWDQVWRRNQYLVAGLLRTDPKLRVLFVEPAADPLYALASRRRPQVGRGLRPVALDGVAAGRLWSLQPTKLFPRRLDPQVDERAAREVRAVAGRLGFDDPILWVNDPVGATTLKVTGWAGLYDITDDWLEAERTPAEHARLVRDEDFLMGACAEVVVCSPGLVATKSQLRPVTLVRNAVDVEEYRVRRPRPRDLPEGPVALYLGTIHTDRIDVGLCVDTATALRGRGSLVLVGPAPLEAADAARLEAAGVLLLGPKDRREVPAYLQHADVLVVPHVVTSFTDSLDPIKLYEYQAVGRPVVSTPVAGFRDSGDPRVSVASGPEFIEQVSRALPSESRFPEGADGYVPTWADRVDQMRAVIERVRGSRASR